MKIDVTQQLVGYDGKVIKEVGEPDDKGVAEKVPMTLRGALTRSLMSMGGENPPGDQKLHRYMLAREIHSEDTPSLSVEDLTLVKKLSGELFMPNVVGAVWTLIEDED